MKKQDLVGGKVKLTSLLEYLQSKTTGNSDKLPNLVNLVDLDEDNLISE